MMRPTDPGSDFDALVRDVRACEVCRRMSYTHILGPANGPLDARVMFVAEAPGRRGAAVTGVPLMGDEAGRRFEQFLRIAELKRADVFVTNAVLCNPLDVSGRNRTPSSAEMTACRPFLERTLEVVQAPVVVTLGRLALESARRIERHDGLMPRDIGTGVPWYGRRLVPMYHPSQQSRIRRSERDQIEDWQRLGALVRTLTRGSRAPRRPLE
jgi:uracil-DNA glycosylase family 4